MKPPRSSLVQKLLRVSMFRLQMGNIQQKNAYTCSTPYYTANMIFLISGFLFKNYVSCCLSFLEESAKTQCQSLPGNRLIVNNLWEVQWCVLLYCDWLPLGLQHFLILLEKWFWRNSATQFDQYFLFSFSSRILFLP